MKPSYLSSSNLIYKAPAHSGKIYIREQKGWFQSIRRKLSFFLITLFCLIPMMRYQGEQAIYFDVGQQKLNIFAVTLFPSDLFVFTILFTLAAFALFYVTKLYGRVWCGFVCPQTVWSLMYSWVERRVEGSHSKSRALDKQAWSFSKTWKKGLKHFIWLVIALMTSLVFMSYFIPVEHLYYDFFTLQAGSLINSWVLFFAGCTYLNAGFMREKMCEHVCPYSRFQSVMFDKSSLLVTYNAERGEGRGKRKIGQAKTEQQGDCVDCDLCVQVCPVGIDIRQGLQYECISCGLCIDACDQTMNRFGYNTRLIDFQPEQQVKSNWRRHVGYGGAIAICLIVMLGWWQQRIDFDLTVSRDRQALSRTNSDWQVENTYLLHVRNKSREQKQYQISVLGLNGAQIKGDSVISVEPGELLIHALAVATSESLSLKLNKMTFKVTELNSEKTQLQTSSFYAF